MVGREEEMRRLETKLEEIVKGKGRAQFISGEAGVGKTRLVRELRTLAEAKGFLFLCGNGLYESLTPYMPIYDALRSGGLEHLFAEEVPRVEAVYLVTRTGLLIKDVIKKETELSSDIFASMLTAVGDFVKESMTKFLGEEKAGSLNTLGYEDYRILIESGASANLVVVMTGKENEFLIDDVREIRQKVENEFGHILQDWDGDYECLRGIESIISPLIESGKYDGIYYGKNDPKAKRNLLFQSVSLGLSRQSEMKPTVLCIEDLQWADPSTLALMHYIARNSRDKRLLVLGSYRQEDVSSKHPLVETMQLMDREDLHEEICLQRLPKDALPDFLRMLGDVDLDEDFVSRVYSETEGNPLFIVQLVKYLVEEKIIETQNGIWRLTQALDEVIIPSKVYNVIVHRLNHVEKEDRRLLDYASVNGEIFTSAVLAAALNARKSDVLERLRTLERTHRLIHSRNGAFKFDHVKIREVLYNEIPVELRREYHETIAHSIEMLNKDDLVPAIGDLAFHYCKSCNGGKALHYLLRAAEKAREEYSNNEAIKCYSEALEFEDEPQKRLKILRVMAEIHALLGHCDRSIELYRQALELAIDPREKAGILSSMGSVYERKGEYDTSLAICTDALNLVKNHNYPEEADSLRYIGVAHLDMSNYDAAMECFNRSLSICEALEDLRGVSRCLGNIGNIHMFKGNYDRASEFLEKSMDIGVKLEDQELIQLSHANLGSVSVARGAYDKGLEHFGKSLKRAEMVGNRQAVAILLNNMGVMYQDMEENEKSLEYFEKTLKIAKNVGDQWLIATALTNIGVVYLSKGDYSKSINYQKGSLEIIKKLGDKRVMTYIHCYVAEAYLRQGKLEKAFECCNRAYELSKEIGVEENVAYSQKLFGMIYGVRREWKKSATSFERSIAGFKVCDNKKEMADAQYEFGLILREKGDFKNASCNLSEALKTFEELKSTKKAEKVRAGLQSIESG